MTKEELKFHVLYSTRGTGKQSRISLEIVLRAIFNQPALLNEIYEELKL